MSIFFMSVAVKHPVANAEDAEDDAVDDAGDPAEYDSGDPAEDDTEE